MSLKRLNERVAELENQLKDQRIEHQAEVGQLQETKATLQAEQNQHIKNELVMEERIKRAQEEAERGQQLSEAGYKKEMELQSQDLLTLKQKLELVELNSRQTEASQAKKIAETEKISALIEQKLALTEKDLSDQKLKLQEKDKDFKELQKEHYLAKVELGQLRQKSSSMENDHQEDIDNLKDKHAREIQKLQDAAPASTGALQTEEKKWLKEREQMVNQMSLLTGHLDSSKKMQESLLEALTRQESKGVEEARAETNSEARGDISQDSEQLQELAQRNQELLSMNNNLSQQIVQMQTKQ